MTHKYTLVPPTGGVGVGKTLQMQVIDILNLVRPRVPHIIQPLQISTENWQSSDSSIASVDQDGVVTGITKDGRVTISVEAKIGTQRVPLRSIISVGSHVSKFDCQERTSVIDNCITTLDVQPLDDNNKQLNNRPITWASDNPEIASIYHPIIRGQRLEQFIKDPSSIPRDIAFQRRVYIKANQVGQTHIRAICEGVDCRIQVIVSESIPSSLTVTPDKFELDVQESKNATAIVLNQGGCICSDANVSWSTQEPGIATVSRLGPNTCKIRGHNPGETKIIASAPNNLTFEIPVIVPAVSRIRLTPSSAELDINESKRFSATLYSSTGKILNNRQISWTKSNNNVRFQDTSDYSVTVVGNHIGSSQVTATSEDVSGTSNITIPSVSDVAISPRISELYTGDEKTLTATLTSSSGKRLNRPVTWSRSNTNASINPNTGRTTKITGEAEGHVRITAESENIKEVLDIDVLQKWKLTVTYASVIDWGEPIIVERKEIEIFDEYKEIFIGIYGEAVSALLIHQSTGEFGYFPGGGYTLPRSGKYIFTVGDVAYLANPSGPDPTYVSINYMTKV